MCCISKDISKIHPVSRANTLHDASDFLNHEMVFENEVLGTEHKFSAK